jgi:hypothetical protein
MKTNTIDPATIVQRQVDAYNNRDIEAYTDVFSDDVCVKQFPDKPLIEGKENFRIHYQLMFEATPDLHCEIVKRMIQGHTVIDQENVLKNGEYINAIAIYQVNESQIISVTFILE